MIAPSGSGRASTAKKKNIITAHTQPAEAISMFRWPTFRSSDRREINIHVNILSVRQIKARVKFLSIRNEVETISPIRTKMFLIKECKLKFIILIN